MSINTMNVLNQELVNPKLLIPSRTLARRLVDLFALSHTHHKNLMGRKPSPLMNITQSTGWTVGEAVGPTSWVEKVGALHLHVPLNPGLQTRPTTLL